MGEIIGVEAKERLQNGGECNKHWLKMAVGQTHYSKGRFGVPTFGVYGTRRWVERRLKGFRKKSDQTTSGGFFRHDQASCLHVVSCLGDHPIPVLTQVWRM